MSVKLERYMWMDPRKHGEWLPICPHELWERGWSSNDLDQRMIDGRLKGRVGNKQHIYFEEFVERWKYLRFRKMPDEFYEEKERELATWAGVEYGKDVSRRRARKEREAEERALRREEGKDAEWGKSIWEVLGFLIQLVCLPFVILFVRDVTQWWYGTGKFAKDAGE